jgi:hypothetical protein
MLLLALVCGAAYGVFELWWFPFSLKTLVAAGAAGATFASVMMTFVLLGRFLSIPLVLPCIFAGSLAGLVWWTIVRATPSPWFAVGLGLVIAIVMYFGEGGKFSQRTGGTV